MIIALLFEPEVSRGKLIGLIEDTPAPVTSGGGNSNVKSGVVQGIIFSGSPLAYDVTFIVPFTDTNYAIVISGTDSRSYTYSNKTQNGFTINTNASQPLSGEVSWMAT